MIVPRISSVVPSSRRPGESISINGTDFQSWDGVQGTRVHIANLDEDDFEFELGADNKDLPDYWRSEFVRPSVMDLMIGINMPPGQYRIWLTNTVAGKVETSDALPVEVVPWGFSLNFLDFSCSDESDEWSGSDEVIAHWFVSVDDQYSTSVSKEYEGVDQGGTYSFDPPEGRLLGSGKKVGWDLGTIVRLEESDSGGHEAANTGFAIAGGISDATKSYPDKDTQDAGAIVGLVVWVISSIVDIFSDDDDLGTQTVTWSAHDLIAKTWNLQHRFEGVLPFDNSDATGSFSVRYEVVREI